MSPGVGPHLFFKPIPWQVLRFLTLFSIAVYLHEVGVGYIYQKYLHVGWILVCLWVLLDASHVLQELDLTKAQLQYSQEQLQLLQKQNMELSAAIYHSTENHVLLCEIRHRIIQHGHKAQQRSFSDLTLQQVVGVDTFDNPNVQQECTTRSKSSHPERSPSLTMHNLLAQPECAARSKSSPPKRSPSLTMHNLLGQSECATRSKSSPTKPSPALRVHGPSNTLKVIPHM